jgi:hypothetical protein
MSQSKTITLLNPITLFDKPIAGFEFKEPTGRQYADFGEPFLYVRNPDGAIYTVEQNDVIKRYLDACIDHESGGHLLALLSLADVKQLKRTLFDFFTDADAALYSKSATPSSSEAA